MEKISEGQPEFKRIEKSVYDIVCSAGCEMMVQYLQRCDQSIMALRNPKEYRAISRRETTIKTIMGEISFGRWYYKRRDGGYVYLLDDALGFSKGIGLVSEHLAERIVNECADKSFRKAAASICELTGQAISAMGAWGVFQRYGERVQAQEKRLEELAEAGVAGQIGSVEVPVLFEEYDDVWVPMQRQTRQRKPEPGGKKRKRTGKKPIRVGTAYAGWTETAEGRYETVGKIAYASFREPQAFLAGFHAFKQHRFDMDGVVRQIVNGDGATWIKAAAEAENAILQLDSFHRSRAVIRAIRDKNERKAILRVIKDGNVDNILDSVNVLVDKESDEKQRDKLRELCQYFSSNKDSLLTWQEREIELPAPPEGILYRGLGTQEHSNCYLLTQRMKHRGASWTTPGATNMAKILCLRNTIGLETMLGALPEIPVLAPQAEPLSAAQTPKCDGKGYDGAWLHADWPFGESAVTSGREAIRGLLKQKPLSELSFI